MTHSVWPFKAEKKNFFYVSINPFLHFKWTQLVSSRFLLTRHNSVLQGRESKRSCVFIKLITAWNLVCLGWKTRKGHRTYPGHPRTRGLSGRWARGPQSPHSHSRPRTPHTGRGELVAWADLQDRQQPGKGLSPFQTQRRGSQSTENVLFLWNHFPLTIWGEQWLFRSSKWVKKCQMQLYWLITISQKYTLTLRLFK